MSIEAIAPVNRLPCELLEQILLSAGCARSVITRNAEHCMIPSKTTPSQVCSLWRGIILESPSFWTTVHVGENVGGNYGQSVQEQIVRKVVKNSQHAGLNVELDTYYSHRILPLLEESTRWERVEISSLSDLSSRRAQMLKVGTQGGLPMLKVLKLSNTISDSSLADALHSAPNLEMLILQHSCIDKDLLRIDEIWPRLRFITGSPFALLSASRTLCWMNRIESMTAMIPQLCGYRLPETVVHFSFSSLKNLSICVGNYATGNICPLRPDELPSVISNILRRICCASQVTSLSLSWADCRPFRTDRAAPSLHIDSLLRFVDRNKVNLICLPSPTCFWPLPS